MRKFTKEISALLASVAVGATACASTVCATTEQIEQTAGVTANPDEIVDYPTEGIMAMPDETVAPTTDVSYPEDIVGTMLPEDVIEPSSEVEYSTDVIGTMLPEDAVEPTTEVELVGFMMPEDIIESTEEEELPPLVGEPLPPDEWTEPTTEEEIPPLAGDIVPVDGDITGDGLVGVSDIILLQKWLSRVSDTYLFNWKSADLYPDGKLNVLDLSLMKKEVFSKNRTV